MPDPLFVLVGAGASADCASPSVAIGRPERKPPLTKELFDDRFEPILREYPLAQAAALDMRREGVLDGAVALERFLATRYAASGRRADQRKFRALPCYLQHVLWEVSEGYTYHADNYDALIYNVIDAVASAVVITLNYDTLLDQRLELYEGMRFADVDDYVSPARGWSLVKLHGSTNWAQGITTPGVSGDAWHEPPADIDVDDNITVMGPTKGAGLQDLRFKSTQPPHKFFPTLSVPLGADDLIACPESHVEFLRSQLASVNAVDLLVVGYSAYDREVIKLLAASGREIRSLFVVNQDGATAMDVLARLSGELHAPRLALGAGYTGSFNAFAQSDGIDNYVRDLDRMRKSH
jgi:hypothetical protein